MVLVQSSLLKSNNCLGFSNIVFIVDEATQFIIKTKVFIIWCCIFVHICNHCIIKKYVKIVNIFITATINPNYFNSLI